MLQDDPNTDSVMLDSPISFNASFSACTLFSLSISWNQGKNEGNSKISFLTLIRVVVTIAVLLGVNLFCGTCLVHVWMCLYLMCSHNKEHVSMIKKWTWFSRFITHCLHTFWGLTNDVTLYITQISKTENLWNLELWKSSKIYGSQTVK